MRLGGTSEGDARAGIEQKTSAAACAHRSPFHRRDLPAARQSRGHPWVEESLAYDVRGRKHPQRESVGSGKASKSVVRARYFVDFAHSTPGRRTRFETATGGDSASSRWRLASPHVAIHPRASGDWYRHRWRFTQGCLAIGIATGGDSPKGVWRFPARQMATPATVRGDPDRRVDRQWRGRESPRMRTLFAMSSEVIAKCDPSESSSRAATGDG